MVDLIEDLVEEGVGDCDQYQHETDSALPFRGSEKSWKITTLRLLPALFIHLSYTFHTLLEHFWITFGTLLEHFLTAFGPFLDHFWITFGALLEHFWSAFGTLLTTFGTVLEHFWCVEEGVQDLKHDFVAVLELVLYQKSEAFSEVQYLELYIFLSLTHENVNS